jgi:hypothetical protein
MYWQAYYSTSPSQFSFLLNYMNCFPLEQTREVFPVSFEPLDQKNEQKS